MDYEVVYNSDVALTDNTDLASYCIFYDIVLLPHTTAESVRLMLEFSRPVGSDQPYVVSAFHIENFCYETQTGSIVAGEDILKWEQDNSLLFEERVISRLPPPKELNAVIMDVGAVLTPTLDGLLRKAGGGFVARGEGESMRKRAANADQKPNTKTKKN
jgi:hypothetical protein